MSPRSRIPFSGAVRAAKAVSKALLTTRTPEARARLEGQLTQMHELLGRLGNLEAIHSPKVKEALVFLKHASAVFAPSRPLEVQFDAPHDGRFHRLHELFARLNAEYFQGRAVIAELRWSPRPSFTRLGYFDPAGDRIVLSQSLDHPAVPDSAVARVLFHEMLHKMMGISCRGGRRLMHPPSFKAVERSFRQFDESERFFKEDWPRFRR